MFIGLNRSELCIGFIYGLVVCVALGWFGLFVCLLTSFFWALSGSSWRVNQKIFRRLGCPIAITIPFYLSTHSLVNLITIPVHLASFIFLSYGMPDPISGDKGSANGIFWTKMFPNDYKAANFCTRATLYLALALGMLPLLWRA